MPSIADIASALEECYQLPKHKRERLSQGARQHAVQYDLRRVAQQHFLPALRVAEQRFANQQPVSIAPRLKAAA
jgi:hypothetical protein